MSKSSKRRIKKLSLIVFACICIGTLSWIIGCSIANTFCTFLENETLQQDNFDLQGEIDKEVEKLLTEADGILAKALVVDYIDDSVKTIDPRTACVIITDGFGHGSGIHIGNGIILTAGHCVNIPYAWIIANDGRTYSIIDQWSDPFDEDIGFIKIRNKDIPSLELGDMPNVMDTVRLIGTPLDLCNSFNVTEGIVSRLHSDYNGWWYDAMIIDAASWPGNSGGPVLNMNNEIVGILVGVYVGYDSLSICEPVENILWSLDAFMNYLEGK